jgi:hypothetical protein
MTAGSSSVMVLRQEVRRRGVVCRTENARHALSKNPEKNTPLAA